MHPFTLRLVASALLTAATFGPVWAAVADLTGDGTRKVTEGNGGTTSAAATVDYVATAGTLTFPPGTTELAIAVQIIGDLLDEPSETFLVRLSNPVGAVIADAEATVTILDDDPTPTLSIDNVSVAEGETGTTPAVFTLSLSAPSGQTVSVAAATANGTATAGSDYAPSAQTVVLPPQVSRPRQWG